jgi:hypothetical protein
VTGLAQGLEGAAKEERRIAVVSHLVVDDGRGRGVSLRQAGIAERMRGEVVAP